MGEANCAVADGGVRIGNHLPLALIAGPCQMESRRPRLRRWPGALKEICGRLGIGLVYKTSFDKANRTSLAAARCRSRRALPIFAEMRNATRLSQC